MLRALILASVFLAFAMPAAADRSEASRPAKPAVSSRQAPARVNSVLLKRFPGEHKAFRVKLGGKPGATTRRFEADNTHDHHRKTGYYVAGRQLLGTINLLTGRVRVAKDVTPPGIAEELPRSQWLPPPKK